MSLTARILAVNLFTLVLLVGGFLFLDSYRARLIEERQNSAQLQVQLIASAIAALPDKDRLVYIASVAEQGKARLRLYNKDGSKIADSFSVAPPTYTIRDPNAEPWRKVAAQWMDQSFDFLVQSPGIMPFVEPQSDRITAWPELVNLVPNKPQSMVRLAPDFTHIVSGATIIPSSDQALLLTTNARDIRVFVRAERFNIGIFFLVAILISVFLSLFLARTIVRPLRRLAAAAVQVRLGRTQEVTVPRLPSRRDEIGLLARALSDMSQALRQRIDATEAFAADVAHEIKNPLASMRSALDGMATVKDPGLRQQLMEVAQADVLRMDRLISDISEASRVDSQLAKTKFERIDLGDMIEQLLQVRETMNIDGDIKIAFARPLRDIASVMGEDIRLERMLTNLIDNAVSFSPSGGVVELSATCDGDKIVIRVSDEGPGVPQNERDTIFRRFYSERPTNEGFGEHSGLGLAIARTIIEGHQGQISVNDREDGKAGACFMITLPSAESKLR